jgi:hypothetical protein
VAPPFNFDGHLLNTNVVFTFSRLPFTSLDFLCTHFAQRVHSTALDPTPVLQTPQGHHPKLSIGIQKTSVEARILRRMPFLMQPSPFPGLGLAPPMAPITVEAGDTIAPYYSPSRSMFGFDIVLALEFLGLRRLRDTTNAVKDTKLLWHGSLKQHREDI